MVSTLIPSADLAPSVTSRVLVVKATDFTEGAPATGEITFSLPWDVDVKADKVILQAGSKTLAFDETGQMQIRVPTADPDSSPDAWFLTVKKSWAPHAYAIRVPVGTTPINLVDVPIVQELPASAAPGFFLTGAGATIKNGPLDVVTTVAAGIATFDFSVPDISNELILVEEERAAAEAARDGAEIAESEAKAHADVLIAPVDGQVAYLFGDQGSGTRQVLSQGLVRSQTSTTPLLRLVDQTNATGATLKLEDRSTHGHNLLDIDHFSNGDSSTSGQTYGINIANNVGARPAFVIHQYSAIGSSVRIDNTDLAPSIVVWNTENQTKNPGGTGTGHFLQFKPYGTSDYFMLTDGLTWLNNTEKNVTIQSTKASAYTFGVDSSQNITGLQVYKRGTGAGSPVVVINKGTSPGIQVLQDGSGLGLRITTAVGATGYAGSLVGQAYGLQLSTEVDGGNALDVNKKASGSSPAIFVRNAGTGPALLVSNSTSQVARISDLGEFEPLIAGRGIVLRSPSGARYRVTVNDAGALTVATA